MLIQLQAIEPIIGHLTHDCRMARCHHNNGELGDKLHAVLCAAGYNVRWLMRAIAQKGIDLLWSLFLRLHGVSTIAPRMLAYKLHTLIGDFNALICLIVQNQSATFVGFE